MRRRYQLALRDQFIEARNTSTYLPQPKNPKGEVHEDVGFISYDRARKRLVFASVPRRELRKSNMLRIHRRHPVRFRLPVKRLRTFRQATAPAKHMSCMVLTNSRRFSSLQSRQSAGSVLTHPIQPRQVAATEGAIGSGSETAQGWIPMNDKDTGSRCINRSEPVRLVGIKHDQRFLSISSNARRRRVLKPLSMSAAEHRRWSIAFRCGTFAATQELDRYRRRVRFDQMTADRRRRLRPGLPPTNHLWSTDIYRRRIDDPPSASRLSAESPSEDLLEVDSGEASKVQFLGSSKATVDVEHTIHLHDGRLTLRPVLEREDGLHWTSGVMRDRADRSESVEPEAIIHRSRGADS